MANKIVMGYWDCAFCGEKKILGTQKACPCCGKVRGADAVFYMDESSSQKQYLTEEEAKTKGKGADWYCSFCDSLNSVLDPVCKSCGASREDSEANYFELQKKKEEKAAKKQAERVEVEQKREPVKKRSPLPFLLIPLLLIAAIVFLGMPKKAGLKITDVFWHNTINVEKHQQVEESNWTMPDDAELIETKQEIQSYVQVIDHYEEETYTVEVQSGSHTEYSYENNGDGTFSEVPYQVPDYTTELRTRQVPVYREDPVYATKYYYLIWVWLQERTVETEGHDKNPVWGETNLAADEREAGRISSYTVTGEKDGKSKEYTVTEEIWNKIKVGDHVECKVKGNTIVSLE